MHRVVLLALLGIPVLVIIHVALFSQQLPGGLPMIPATVGWDRDHAVLQGHWRISDQSPPIHLVINHLPQQGL